MKILPPFGKKVLQRLHLGARVEGVDVVMTIGHREQRLTYSAALKLGYFLWHAGKFAKRAAGDTSRLSLGLAYLTDANLDELEAQRSRDSTAVYGSGSART